MEGVVLAIAFYAVSRDPLPSTPAREKSLVVSMVTGSVIREGRMAAAGGRDRGSGTVLVHGVNLTRGRGDPRRKIRGGAGVEHRRQTQFGSQLYVNQYNHNMFFPFVFIQRSPSKLDK